MYFYSSFLIGKSEKSTLKKFKPNVSIKNPYNHPPFKFSHPPPHPSIKHKRITPPPAAEKPTRNRPLLANRRNELITGIHARCYIGDYLSFLSALRQQQHGRTLRYDVFFFTSSRERVQLRTRGRSLRQGN